MSTEPIEIRPLRASDAESLVACFRRCYGGTYVAEVFGSADAVAEAVEAGRLGSVVAVSPPLGVVGHMGLTPRERGALTAELGNTVIDRAFRGQNLTNRLTLALARRCLELGLVGFVHYPTTAHLAMQRLAQKGRGVELGVLLDYIPAQTHYVGFDASKRVGRVAVVAVYHALAAAPARRVRVPARYREVARSIYSRAGIERELDGADEALPKLDSQLTARFEERRALLRIEVPSPGADLADRVLRVADRHPAAPVMLDLPLCEPSVQAATEALLGEGFFFGALLPEYATSGDVLRLQRPADESTEPGLETSESRALFAFSLRDRAARGR